MTSITTTAAATALDALGVSLSKVADAKPAADAFLTTLHAATGGTPAPTFLTRAALAEQAALAGSFDAMHGAVKAALGHVEAAPSISSPAADGARQLTSRLAETEQLMAHMKLNPGLSVDVSDLTLDIRSRIDDIVGRGHQGVEWEANMLRQISM